MEEKFAEKLDIPVQKKFDRLTLRMIQVSGALIFIMCLGSSYATLVRWLINGNLGWSIEVIQILLGISAVLALGYSQKMRKHVSMTFIDQWISTRTQRIVDIFRFVFYLGAVICLCYGIIEMVVKAAVEHQYTEMYRIPIVVPESILLFGFIVLVIQLCFDLAEAILRKI